MVANVCSHGPCVWRPGNVIVGENRTFDHVFATYTSPSGDAASNLLSRGIIAKGGKPGPNWALATQYSASVKNAYAISPTTKDP